MRTFTLEDGMRAGIHHLESLIDEQGRTYFDIFLTQPAEAVTDWPDFIDLPARYFEIVALLEPLLERPLTVLPALRQRLFSFIEHDGLAYRPETPISTHRVELFDQSRLLTALVTWVIKEPENSEIRNYLQGMLEGLYALATFIDDYAYIREIGIYFGGTLIRPLVQAGLILNDPLWIDFAGQLTRGILEHSHYYAADGSFSGHVHSALGTLAGMLAYAIVRNDTSIRERVLRSFEYTRSFSTSFGFVPELAQRKDDLVGCETCGIMDYLDVAILLARYVDGRYWEVVEKVARNHLVESQLCDQEWLATAPEQPDEDGIIRSNLADRMRGAFAGWSAPHALLAYEEHLPTGWVKEGGPRERYLGKVRAVQNCCAGAGIKALYQVWSTIVIDADGKLDITMLLDKRTPAITITSFAPYEGRAVIELHQDRKVRMRVPGDPPQVSFRHLTQQQQLQPIQHDGIFFDLGHLSAGTRLEVLFEQPERQERIHIGNEGYQQYAFDVTWRGETVLSIIPLPQNARQGRSHLMEQPVRLFYAEAGPGPLYQRTLYRQANASIEAAENSVDSAPIDWYRLL